MKVIISFVVFASFSFTLMFFGVSLALAETKIIITEIMYDVSGTDGDHEWIEVNNTGTESIDLSLLRLYEGGVGHKITQASSATSSEVIPPSGFAVIADSPSLFLADNPGYTGLLYDSTFSLSNEGETIAIKDESSIELDSVAYISSMGANGNGNSIQKNFMGVFISALPTPGASTTATVSESQKENTENTSSSTEAEQTPSESASHGSSVSAHSSPEPVTTSYSLPEFEITAGRSRVGFIGTPMKFEAKVMKSKDIPKGTGLRSSWSMGDGIEIFGDIINHVYEFAGEYAVVVNCDFGGAHAVARTKVKIVEPKLKIRAENFIEIENQDETEINIGGFIIEDAKARFIVPMDTIIDGHGSIKIPPAGEKVLPIDEYVRIAVPSGKIIDEIKASLHDEEVITLPNGLTSKDIEANFRSAIKIYGESFK